MVKVGITGGIGSGKSIVCEAFSLFSAPIYSADNRAKWLIENNSFIIADIKQLIGDDAYFENGKYNRNLVAEIAFQKPEILAQLNEIVHPRVKQDATNWFIENEASQYVIYEAALMNAAKNGNDLDMVISVIADEEVRIQRILKRDTHRNLSSIKAILKNQKTVQEFIQIADYIISNNNNDLLLSQVIELDRKIRNN